MNVRNAMDTDVPFFRADRPAPTYGLSAHAQRNGGGMSCAA